jgi:hypothetical protein
LLFFRLFEGWRYVTWRLRSRGKDEDSLEPFVVEPLDALDEAADWLIIGVETGEWTVWIEGEPNGTVSILCSKGWEQNP